jgi:hypothetical protein
MNPDGGDLRQITETRPPGFFSAASRAGANGLHHAEADVIGELHEACPLEYWYPLARTSEKTFLDSEAVNRCHAGRDTLAVGVARGIDRDE